MTGQNFTTEQRIKIADTAIWYNCGYRASMKVKGVIKVQLFDRTFVLKIRYFAKLQNITPRQ
jgi:hypothetical protein